MKICSVCKISEDDSRHYEDHVRVERHLIWDSEKAHVLYAALPSHQVEGVACHSLLAESFQNNLDNGRYCLISSSPKTNLLVMSELGFVALWIVGHAPWIVNSVQDQQHWHWNLDGPVFVR